MGLKAEEEESAVSRVEEKLYDISAFIVPRHHSILYRSFLTKGELIAMLDEALSDGANVVSIREVVETD